MALDAIELEVLRNKLVGIAEEMGDVLIHAAYSPNIKERQDCSTALFDAEGRMIAQAEHIPVHLGAMPEAVEAVRNQEPEPGDTFVLNDPFTGGTHLPDITIVSPIAIGNSIVAYGVSRAHHSDVGGRTPGSMPAGAQEIYEEGLRIPPVRLQVGGSFQEDVLSLVLSNVRNPAERTADLRAQLAANKRADKRLTELCNRHGLDTVSEAFDAVIDYSRERIATELGTIPDGTYSAADVLEGDGITEEEIPIQVELTVEGDHATLDFTGTADQVPGNMNAPPAVAQSAVYFVLRSVTDPDIPPNAGCYEPVTVQLPEGSLLNPTLPAAVVGGNVETSQRVMDVVFSAFAKALPEQIPAQGQGTMNNLIIGSRTHEGFTYYETIAGGSGARPTGDGLDGVQVGMTNTLNTPIEALEASYPLTVEKYALREGSGGKGKYRGGMGIIRSVRVDEPAMVSLLTERRRTSPEGQAGGEPGSPGENLLDGEPLPAKTTVAVDAGARITVKTPGGGGFGELHGHSDSEPDNDAKN